MGRKKRRGKMMATQIAATPTLKGQDAKRLLDSLNYQPTENSRKNGQKLIAFFQNLEKKGK